VSPPPGLSPWKRGPTNHSSHRTAVNVAFGLVLSSGQAGSPRGSRAKRDGLALAILAATATIIRSELACLLAPLALALLAKRRLSLTQTIGWGALGGLGGTALTIAVDSAFWGHLTWPEAYGVWFNVVRNESAKQWGTSPWSYYLKHLPLLLLAAAPLALLAGLVRPVRRRLDWTVGILPVATMVGAMSALGHKEWRFVAYVVPWLNVPAAVMAARLWVTIPAETSLSARKRLMFHSISRRWQPASSPSALRLLSRTLVLGALAANAMAAGGLLWISVGNYPGGDIMRGPMRDELRRFGGRPGAASILCHSAVRCVSDEP
jgi:alpha-1,6-mannosyltransferase